MFLIDSPQMGQVYGLSSRLPHYHPNYPTHQSRYCEPSEPPPAHRQVPSHGSLAALGTERSLSHMAALSTPDRAMTAHTALPGHMGGMVTPERPLTSHHPERPSHGSIGAGAGLGAAGNLMGAVARHVGADAPASQRGVQAATPPHASQVPAQAESLLILLKVELC